MKSDSTLLVISIVAVVVAAFALVFTVINLSFLQNILLSPSTQGVVNVEIAENAEIVFSVSTIDWGRGSTGSGNLIEFLDTNDTASPDQSRPLGKWGRGPNFPSAGDGGDNGNGGFVLDNIGNVDVELRLSASNNATTFVGGGAGAVPDPIFAYFLRETAGNGCTVETGTSFTTWNNFTVVALPQNGPVVCGNFSYKGISEGLLPAAVLDRLEVNVRIGVPEDSPTGVKQATVFAYAIGL